MEVRTSTEMSSAERSGTDMSSLERSNHVAFLEGTILYVWGGCQQRSGTETVLPSDEIWLYDLERGVWARRRMAGEAPPPLSGACGSYLDGTFYVFGGSDSDGHTNQMYSVDLREECFIWKRLTNTSGPTPSPRDKHTCWIHGHRLIYFGGYGCKTIQEVSNSLKSFVVNEMSWMMIGGTTFRFWGWNNEVSVFDTLSAAWSQPETRGLVPGPRASHASATLGDKGYICGGLEIEHLDLHCLDLETWTWTQIGQPSQSVLAGRLLHTLCPASDHTLFLYGGLGMTTGEAMSDGWEFDTLTREWKELDHSHRDKPRLCHTACLGRDNDVVVFGGSQDFSLLMDSIMVLSSPSQSHCKDVLVFQNQPYPLFRLCEDSAGRNANLLQDQLTWLPPKLQEKVNNRVSFFS